MAAIFSLLILSEPITRLQVAGGLAIAGAILLSRRPQPVTVAPAMEGAPR